MNLNTVMRGSGLLDPAGASEPPPDLVFLN